ncbi:hypothetical protein C1H46_041395 [Malus baccata]|uniref:Uncharacterized protein n=1 Tax=Malus baccata TaxID=106549 RepID=A0A540KFR6_MALBA|nr:hypothetical protein C1H46_041395 [Malus baccata]
MEPKKAVSLGVEKKGLSGWPPMESLDNTPSTCSSAVERSLTLTRLSSFFLPSSLLLPHLLLHLRACPPVPSSALFWVRGESEYRDDEWGIGLGG